MPKEIVMRGKTASGQYEILNFSGKKEGAYRLVEFQLFPSTSIGTQNCELSATITSAKLTGSPPASPANPTNPDFSQEGLIGTSLFRNGEAVNYVFGSATVINDTFLITQDLILSVIDNYPGAPMDVNWQCRFVKEKLTGSEEAVTNYKQFTISDGS